ncbi:MAG: ATP-binding protein [Bacteroidetes bacterium]|nr:ATP-binding protein [Bacteroidota bacterium]MDA0888348.1 ATP-binding protein [Bacteroidota bacterium]MDA1084665.1 ATP-binding protein [Bacteroidota bacterium]
MFEKQKVVFTGSPASGKTTLLNCVNHPEIACYEEVSRAVISASQANGTQRPFLENPLAFSETIFENRLHDYFKVSNTPVQLYDRGIHDVVAYLHELGDDVPCGMEEDCKNFTYDKVFIFPPWEAIFEQDEQREEDFNEAKKLHIALVETYTTFGMKCIEVPLVSVAQRLAFILKNL